MSKLENIAISVKGIYKSFKLPHEQHSGIKQLLVNHLRGIKGYENQHVLRDISFEVKKGEFFGIVGRNGSGKSTLLKLIADIYVPDRGKVEASGSLTPFIELGVGFNPELTGRENVFLNGALLGFSRKEMEAMYESIVEFAELEKFMDQKLKNYSSGMQVRLAFSIAIKANSDILILDEVLAVGDADFQRKCFDYFLSLKNSGKTVVLVTHDMGAVRMYCDRAILIEKGDLIAKGTAQEIAQEYHKLFMQDNKITADAESDQWGDGGVELGKTHVNVTDAEIYISTEFVATTELPPPVYGFTLYNSAGVVVLEANTLKERIKTSQAKKGSIIKIIWSFSNILPDGKFTLSVACCDQSTTRYYMWVNNAIVFSVKKRNITAGVVDPTIQVILEDDNDK